MSAIQFFAEGGSWTKGTNASFITLVPKIVNPQLLNDFRPISLVGCVYKIVSKILSSRLKRVLDKVTKDNLLRRGISSVCVTVVPCVVWKKRR